MVHSHRVLGAGLSLRVIFHYKTTAAVYEACCLGLCECAIRLDDSRRPHHSTTVLFGRGRFRRSTSRLFAQTDFSESLLRILHLQGITGNGIASVEHQWRLTHRSWIGREYCSRGQEEWRSRWKLS
ncbi:hypothetical protein R1flu_011594 [Riccia fluitans]|uniref:Uncharacterized protein n=1 Tax=Riccia fluitans TaxID=41844 RepID=A0ABD1Z886_9MARC